MKLPSLFLFLILLCNFFRVDAGNPDFKNSDELIEFANQLYDSGDYKGAIVLLDRVSRSDPNYTMACYELALNYYALGNTEKAFARCEEAEYLQYDQPYLYSLMGSIRDDEGKPDEGIRILLKALKKWPYNQNIIYNLGVCYLNAGKPDSAERILLNNVIFYPYHTRSHLALANANYAMGRIAQSYLGYYMSILLSPNSTNINDLENIIGGGLKLTPRAYLYPYPAGINKNYWDNLKNLIQSELAFNKDFEFPYDEDFTFARQALMLFGNLKYDPSDTSVYSRFYSRLFSTIMHNNNFETFVNYCLNNLGHQGGEAWNKKNPGKIDGFIAWAQEFINKGRECGYYPAIEQSGKRIHHYNDQNGLTAIGEQTISDETKNGNFIIISNNGSISEKGKYVNNISEGEWLIYWPGGEIRQDLEFLNGKLNDTIKTYHSNGSRARIIPFRTGERNGIAEEYSSSGNLVLRNTYSRNKLNGPGIYYNYSEAYVREFEHIQDTLSGSVTENWMNGKPKSRYSNLKGEYEGDYKSWYPNGNPESAYQYKAGLKTGPGLEYHTNGVLSDTGAFEAGKYTGVFKSFDDKGRLVSATDKFTDGLLSGHSLEYYENGSISTDRYVETDKLKNLLCYDDQGRVLYETKPSGDTFYFKSFYHDGIVMSEGLMVMGKQEGLWKNYNPMGVLIGEKHYQDDMHSGRQKIYFRNGAVSEEYLCDSNNIIGPYRSYYKNGHLQAAGNYVKAGLDGEYITYFPNDSVQSVTFYKNGVAAGRRISYHPDGRKYTEDFFNDKGNLVRSVVYDRFEGIESDWIYNHGAGNFKVYYPGGRLKSCTPLSEHVRHGIQEVYFPNGQLASAVNYIFGKPDGEVRKYDYKGNLTSLYHYVLGKLEGESITYADQRKSYQTSYRQGVESGKVIDYHDFNGKISREICMENDQRQGYSDYYAPDGNLMYRIRYEKNAMKGYCWKNSMGNFVPEVAVTEQTREIVTYYPNGRISARIGLEKGMYQGKLNTWYSNGNPLTEAEYADDDITGIQKRYYSDGKVRQVTTYLHDEENGPYTEFHQNGKISVSGAYLGSAKHGDWHYFDETGKETDTIKYYHDEIYEIIEN